MPIPANQQIDWEIQMQGIIASAGSTTKFANFVFHFKRTTLITTVNPTSLDNAFNTNIAALVLAAINVRFTGTHHSVRCINDALYAPVFISRTGAGVISGDSMATTLASYACFARACGERAIAGVNISFP